ncbi:SDR family oxidoreductase [Shewanella cyperi]|uniref:SDR family oxidoreductase n=1 Tax=Shewanella cyperi TaxID=2814292 RepID=A0A975AIZ0_9GAMM|nr:SDR family oxidoreductase [Shewanella cyperi]QSX28752.1 SDR family oxidoreductase [Shewanella cyperi]
MNKINTVAIVGCGWFGLPLARHLMQKGFSVKGCKRSPEGAAELTREGIDAFVLDLEQPVPEATQALLDADALVINIPPGLRRGDSGYLQRLAHLVSALGDRRYQRLVFISTTGVYPELAQPMTEKDAEPHSDTARTLLTAEAMFGQQPNATLMRFAGLVGPGRHPGRFFAGRQGVAAGGAPVNLVHLDDCVAAVTLVLESANPDSCYNLCAPLHPTKAEFYRAAAEALQLPSPQFAEDVAGGKAIDGEHICANLGFHYRYPDPLAMLQSPDAF